MRIILFVCVVCFLHIDLKAERILYREKYNIIISSDTVYAGDDYALSVDLKGNKNGIVLRNGYPVGMSDGKGYIKFRAAATSYDKNGISKQRIDLAVIFDKDSIFEEVTFFVAKPPVSVNDTKSYFQSGYLYRVQDSLTVVLYNQEPYRDVEYLYSHKKYFFGFAEYLEKSLPLKDKPGQLLVMVIVDSAGKVIKYDIVKNTYKTITLKEIEKAIHSYRLVKDFEYDGSLKFSAVINTVEGDPGNFIMKSQY